MLTSRQTSRVTTRVTSRVTSVPFRVQAKRTRISYELFPMVVFCLLTGNEARPYYV